MSDNDTIVAQATPPGRGGVGILRISGFKAREVAETVLGKLHLLLAGATLNTLQSCLYRERYCFNLLSSSCGKLNSSTAFQNSSLSTGLPFARLITDLPSLFFSSSCIITSLR